MLITRSHLASLGIAAFMACAIPAIAQDVQDLVAGEVDVDVVQDLEQELDSQMRPRFADSSNRYRIGLDCEPSSAPLQSHLHLDDDTGLTVKMVLPNSPAAVSGIKQHDVIVEANGRPVGQVMDLVRQVNEAKGDEMPITLIREGEEHLVKVTPEERDEDELNRLRNGFRNQLGQPNFPGFEAMRPEFEEMFKNFPQMNQFGNGSFRRINPGIAIPSLPNIPNDFSLRIQRNNDKVTVERGNDRYEVTTDTLDQLPDDVRPMVENMLNGGSANLNGLFAPNRALPARPQLPVAPAVPRRQNNQQLQDRFDGLELRLKELQDAIKSIEK